jgi:hypothetical protein
VSDNRELRSTSEATVAVPALQAFIAASSGEDIDVVSMQTSSRQLFSSASSGAAYHQGVLVRVQGLANLLPTATQGQVKLGKLHF